MGKEAALAFSRLASPVSAGLVLVTDIAWD